VTYEAKKERLDDIKRCMTTNMVGYVSVSFLIEELEKAWAALDFYADVDNTIIVSADFIDDKDCAHIWIGKRAREALNT